MASDDLSENIRRVQIESPFHGQIIVRELDAMRLVVEAAGWVEQIFKDYNVMDKDDKFFEEDPLRYDRIGCDGLKMLHELRERHRAYLKLKAAPVG